MTFSRHRGLSSGASESLKRRGSRFLIRFSLFSTFSNHGCSFPEYDPDEPISATETGISLKAVSEVDVEVTVHLTDFIPPDVIARAQEVFVGAIPAPSKKVAVVTSENEKLVESDVSSTTAQVRVWVDDPEFPTTIWVEAR